jgi:membrane fusion protein, copper/silver efflux system
MFASFINSCKIEPKQSSSKVTTTKGIYYCPMHPEIVQDHPGICPKPECQGMALIKKEPAELLESALKPVDAVVLSNIRSIKPETKTVVLTISSKGKIDYDERTRHNIASRFDGRIEKLYVRYNYQPVVAGQRIFDIYSPELITAQQNLIYLQNNDPSASDLINAAKNKLKILGLTDEQVSSLTITRKVQNIIPVYSKWSGHIHEAGNVGGATAAGDGMNDNSTGGNSSNSESTMSSELSVKEGMYVNRGQTIFNVVNPQDVVVSLQIRAEDLAKVKLNQEVTFIVDENPRMEMKGKISFIQPVINYGSKTGIARVYIDNKEHRHKVGSLVNGIITTEVSGMWIPATAVVDIGRDKIVWVRKGDQYLSKKIQAGVVAAGWVEVKDGISENDEIASEAHYLSDSEGFIKTNEDE